MTIRTRIFLVYLVLVGGGLAYLAHWISEQVRPRYLESMEESLVDTANLLATVVETKAVDHGRIDPAAVRLSFDPAYRRKLDARIYSIQKTDIDLRVYVTDGSGRVLYDSAGGRAEGEDYSHWNDVRRTLAGKYGARGTRVISGDDMSLVIDVAAPIFSEGRIVGSLTVGKPTKNINALVAVAQRRIVWAAILGGALIVGTGFAFSVWLTTPLARLTSYARAVRDGKPATLPRLAGREVGDLRRAFEEMRAALEGKQYIERYTQALTHEIKAPLSAIRGAAELLTEEMPPAERARFLENIRNEAERIQHLIDQLLQLATLEGRKSLSATEPIPLDALIADVLGSLAPTLSARRIQVSTTTVPLALALRGDRFLIRLALTNLLKNAVEFSPVGSAIEITASVDRGRRIIRIDDQGAGIPEFARERIFDRFYSLPRPDTGAKSTGLGLSFVQEIAHLHGGTIRVINRETGGCRAELAI